MRNVRKGQIYYADLNPTQKSEQGGIRPVLIIQNNIGNKYSPTTIIAPLTSKVSSKRQLPTHIFVPSTAKLPQDSLVLLEQIRTIDKTRLQDYIGTLTTDQMKEIDKGICISFGLED